MERPARTGAPADGSRGSAAEPAGSRLVAAPFVGVLAFGAVTAVGAAGRGRCS